MRNQALQVLRGNQNKIAMTKTLKEKTAKEIIDKHLKGLSVDEANYILYLAGKLIRSETIISKIS